jgi:ABC-type Fe3+/spermidine/putrescine transport system ATPase subunit
MMQETSLVYLDQVSKIYPTAKGEFYAVRQVTIDVQPGEFYSLLGSSGSGKTTTLRLIGGFEIPEYGQVFIGGEAVTTLPPYRRNVHTVFQSYALFPHLTVVQNIAYPLTITKVPAAEIAARVQEALRMFRIAELGDRRPAQLSGGQQQRVALARALINRPKVLLLDEPLSALDAKIREEVRQELRELQRQTNLTFIYVTHDQEEALALSDRIAVMHNGQVEQVGTPREIYKRPASAFVAQFIGRANFLTGKVVGSAADKLQVEVQGNLIQAAAPNPIPAPGETVTLMIRPEQLQIQAQDTTNFNAPHLPHAANPSTGPNKGLNNQVAGQITSVTYIGQLLQIQVETPIGSLLVTKLDGTEPTGNLMLSWTPADCIVIPQKAP